MKKIFAITLLVVPMLTVAQGSFQTDRLTDALDAAAWERSEWISAVDVPVIEGRVNDNTRAADGASWFVTTVTNERKVKSARWMTTALGVYDIYVNGQRIGEEVLKPGFTHHAKTRRAFTYDITSLIRRKAGATNQLSVEVTPGWWADKIITPSGNDGMIGKKCAFRGVLQLTYTNGETQLFGSNTEDWRAGISGPVKHAAIFDGEEFDARQQSGFAAAETFKKPEINTEFSGEILPTDGAEIYLRHDLTLSPVKAYVWQGVAGADDKAFGKVNIKKEFATGETMTVKAGETLVVDFGQNCAAVPQFVFKAKEGTRLTCLPGELLNDGNGAKSRGMDGPEGSVHRLNLRIQEKSIRLDYTFAAGDKPATYIPSHTFFGYRFVSVTATDDVTIYSLRSIPVSSITKEMETGRIETGNELVNRLIQNTLWGQRSNYLSVPTDCPQRNERLGWTADTQVFSETGSFFANTNRFLHKWMRDVRDCQGDEGGYTSVAPPGQYGDDHSRLGWSDAGVIVPWTVWKQFGDTEIIEENWAAMKHYMAHLAETRFDHNAMLSENGNYQWGDWLSYEPLETCSGIAFDSNGPKSDAVEYWSYLGASYWIIDAEMMRDMAQATGRDGEKYSKMADEARAYVRERFFDEDGRFRIEVLNTMQTPALFALKNNIVTGEAKERMKAALRLNFAQHGGCLQTGFLGTSILMQTLTECGMTDIAYDLLFQRKNPSWLYSVDNGATTIWERWNSYMIEKGMGPRGMNSFNHYAYGCVCQWLWETAAGIAADTSVPGFHRIIMRPVPDRRLGHLSAEYQSAAGMIKSAWRYEGDIWTWTFTIPKGCTALVTLPGETSAKEYTAGTYTLTLPESKKFKDTLCDGDTTR